jgi:uncharacterized membrane protein YfcA
MMQTAPAPAPGSTTARLALFVALGIVTLAFIGYLARALRARAAAGDSVRPRGPISVVSFIANFLDTLGIGSFATTTTMVRQFKLISDERIPGSLNVGYVLPTVLQAFVSTGIVPVDPITLIVLIVASMLGAWLGAGVVSSWPRRKIQIGMGIALLTMATLMTLSHRQVALLPAGGEALALTGPKLLLGFIGNFILGALMTLGIGLYAPCMVLVALLGMNLKAAYPIMMGSCAFLMPIASIRFLKTASSYEPKAILGMALAGVPAVALAFFVFDSLSMDMIKWLVVAVVVYTAVNMLRTARRERNLAADATAAEAQPAL